MSDVESFVRFCESEFGSAVMDHEAAYVTDHVSLDDRILDVGCGIGSLEERLAEYDIVGVDLGYQLQQARDSVVIYTGISQMPSHLRETLRSSCNLVNYEQVQFEMCVGAHNVMLPNAEYDGDQVREIHTQQNNLCDHDYGSSIGFLQSVLEYPVILARSFVEANIRSFHPRPQVSVCHSGVPLSVFRRYQLLQMSILVFRQSSSAKVISS